MADIEPATKLKNSDPSKSWRLKPGQSGNPAGKAPGTRNKVSVLAMKLLSESAEDVIATVLAAAKDGDIAACKLVLDRISPPSKDAPVTFSRVQIETAADVAAAMNVVLEATAAGELTPSEGATVAGIIENRRRAIETVELQQRVEALEHVRRQHS